MADRLARIVAVAERLDALGAKPDAELRNEAVPVADELLRLGETILEAWLAARGEAPTRNEVEGFRLLALHRQGARGDPSYNACRETCREIVYCRNLIAADPFAGTVVRTLKLAVMVVRHLALFVGGKMEVAGLGDFCCSSRPLRTAEPRNPNVEVA
jgi:hypothetical protein